MPRCKPPLKIRRGDIWDLLTNNGILRRHVKSVACGIVYYINCEGSLESVSLAGFRRWAKSAELVSAEDWDGRSVSPNLSHPATPAKDPARGASKPGGKDAQ
jgi:hypothetical protein